MKMDKSSGLLTAIIVAGVLDVAYLCYFAVVLVALINNTTPIPTQFWWISLIALLINFLLLCFAFIFKSLAIKGRLDKVPSRKKRIKSNDLSIKSTKAKKRK